MRRWDAKHVPGGDDTSGDGSPLREKPCAPRFVLAARGEEPLPFVSCRPTRAPNTNTNPLLAAGIEALRVRGEGAPVIASRYAIVRTRGIPVDAEIAQSQAGQAIELRVLPEFTAEHRWTMEPEADYWKPRNL